MDHLCQPLPAAAIGGKQAIKERTWFSFPKEMTYWSSCNRLQCSAV